MQHNSQIYLNDYEAPSTDTPPPPRKHPNPGARSKSFQDPGPVPNPTVRSKSFQDQAVKGDVRYECLTDHLQMPGRSSLPRVQDGQRSLSCVDVPYPRPDKRDRSRNRTPDTTRSPDRIRTPDSAGRSSRTERRRKSPPQQSLLDRPALRHSPQHSPHSESHDSKDSSTSNSKRAKDDELAPRSKSARGATQHDLEATPTNHHGDSRPRDGYHHSDKRSRDQHTRAYSDSEAENYQEAAYHDDFSYPGYYRKHRNNERRRLPPPPPVYLADERYYKLPYRPPYPYTSQEDSDYDVRNFQLKPPRPLVIPDKVREQTYRPYPARFTESQHCPYQSQPTENDYYTPSAPKDKRRNSDSSSCRTLLSPWTNQNKILTPKYPLPAPSSHTATLVSNTNKHLNKIKCAVSNNNVWHDPLLGQDRRDVAYTGDANSEEEGKDKNPLESFAEFTIDVTMNYMRYVWNSPEIIRKLIWGVLFLGFFWYSFLCCFRSFSIYVSRPTSTKYNMYYEPRKELLFPSITICNMNPHNKTFLDFPKNLPLKSYLYETLKSPWPLKNDMEDIDRDVLETQRRSFNVKNYYRDSGQRIEDFIENVTFLEEDLKLTDAFKEQFTTHGLCWTFNANGSRKVNRTGMDFGLSFGLNLNQELYPDFVTTAGVKVMFHNYYEPALIDEYGMALSPGTENFISLSYERIKNLKMPYGNCSSEPPSLYRNYSVSGCERQCFTEVMMDECKCRSYYLKGPPSYPVCNLYQETTCVENVTSRYHAGEFLSKPSCLCQDACVSETYKATLSTAEYPAKNYGQALEKWNSENNNNNNNTEGHRDVQFYRENFLKVHIYFEILSIKEVEKVSSYKWSNLMGDVGGQLGLFLGANIVTIFEFVDFYLRLFWYRFMAEYVVKFVKGRRDKT